MSNKQKVGFIATKYKDKPVQVIFYTKSGDRVSFGEKQKIPTKTKEVKIRNIEINIEWEDGYSSATFIQRRININKLTKENPVLQRIIKSELA